MKKIYFALLFCLACYVVQGQVVPPFSYLNVNNVGMRISGIGSQIGSDTYVESGIVGCPYSEMPIGSGTCTLGSQGLWVGGLDANDGLHFSSCRGSVWFPHGSEINPYYDYWSGPLRLADASTDMMTMLNYYHVWNLTRDEIEYFRQHYGDSNYQIPDDILSWPAHGEDGFAENLAPFVDVNGDNHYNPLDGDYPDIKGDQCLFFIFNDSYADHTESFGLNFGLEIHAMVYAFDMPDDEALNNTVFFSFKIFNRSHSSYHDTYIGIWNDMDIGYPWDDFVGCDVLRNSVYTYNGDDFDESTGHYYGYYNNWPVQVCTILAGPFMDADGRDNPAFEGDIALLQDPEHPNDQYAYNGRGFGNGIEDDERFGLCHSNRNSENYLSYGFNNPEKFYSQIRNDAVNFRFYYPGDSDPFNWGTGCTTPPSDFYATEEEAGNEPESRRVLGSCGPFTFKAGQVQEIDFAQITVFGNEEQTQMERRGDFIDRVRAFYESQNAK